MAKRKFVLTPQEVDEINYLLNGKVDAIGQRRSTLYHWCRARFRDKRPN